MKQNVAAHNIGMAAVFGAGAIAGQSWSGLVLWLLTVIGSLAAFQPWQLERFMQRGRHTALAKQPPEASATSQRTHAHGTAGTN